jgi:hypothetical protein
MVMKASTTIKCQKKDKFYTNTGKYTNNRHSRGNVKASESAVFRIANFRKSILLSLVLLSRDLVSFFG